MLCCLSLAVLVGVLSISTASAGEGRLQLAYRAYFAGVRAANLDLGVEFDAASYDPDAAAFDLDASAYAVRVRLKTTGLVKTLTRLKTTAYSHGALVAGDIVPVRAGYSSKRWRKKRLVELGFDGGTPSVLRMKPRRKAGNSPAVAPAELKGALDPAGALLAVLSRLDGGKGCELRIPVFTGRRLYELVGEARGTARLKASQYSPFAGPTVTCRLRLERKAGFKRETGRRRDRHHTDVKLHVARVFDEMPPVPVRFAGDTGYGSLTAYLHRAKLDGGGLKREFGPRPGRKRRR
ncbi:MAG: DUF3108 domain-containing protein [Deltaproteobacteria bacterium]|nr:DUF3108 domain-containing protein [Deltaproteobacteria bacterium]